MRTAVVLLVLAFAAVASAQPAAPVHKGAVFAGGAAQCTPGNGIIALNGGAGSGCADCVAGYFQAGSGSLACTACPAGSWSPVGSKQCFACPSGTVSNAASDSCDECGFGTVTAQYQSNGLNYGSYSVNVVSNTQCFPCAENFYQPNAAQQNCIACPANTSTAGAKGAGACFAVGGGHTVGAAGAVGATAPAASFLEQPAGAAHPKSDAQFVAPAASGPKAPIRKTTRGSHKPTGGAAPASHAKTRFAARRQA